MDMKQCNRCKVEKLISDFPENCQRCFPCKKYCDDYYVNNRDKEIKRALKSYNKKDNEAVKKYKNELRRRNKSGDIIQRLRSKSKLNNIPFNLTKEDIIIPEYCPILSLKLTMNDDKVGPDSISVDRIIPELGYVKGNIEIISHKANTIKNNASVEDLEKILSWLKEKLKNK